MDAVSTMSSNILIKMMTINNRRGLHARASAKFVQCAERFEADVYVSRDGQKAGASSIMGLMMLAAGPGMSIEVQASGRDAQAALDAIEELVATGFGENNDPPVEG